MVLERDVQAPKDPTRRAPWSLWSIEKRDEKRAIIPVELFGISEIILVGSARALAGRREWPWMNTDDAD